MRMKSPVRAVIEPQVPFNHLFIQRCCVYIIEIIIHHVIPLCTAEPLRNHLGVKYVLQLDGARNLLQFREVNYCQMESKISRYWRTLFSCGNFWWY